MALQRPMAQGPATTSSNIASWEIPQRWKVNGETITTCEIFSCQIWLTYGVAGDYFFTSFGHQNEPSSTTGISQNSNTILTHQHTLFYTHTHKNARVDKQNHIQLLKPDSPWSPRKQWFARQEQESERLSNLQTQLQCRGWWYGFSSVVVNSFRKQYNTSPKHLIKSLAVDNDNTYSTAGQTQGVGDGAGEKDTECMSFCFWI